MITKPHTDLLRATAGIEEDSSDPPFLSSSKAIYLCQQSCIMMLLGRAGRKKNESEKLICQKFYQVLFTQSLQLSHSLNEPLNILETMFDISLSFICSSYFHFSLPCEIEVSFYQFLMNENGETMQGNNQLVGEKLDKGFLCLHLKTTGRTPTICCDSINFARSNDTCYATYNHIRIQKIIQNLTYDLDPNELYLNAKLQI